MMRGLIVLTLALVLVLGTVLISPVIGTSNKCDNDGFTGLYDVLQDGDVFVFRMRREFFKFVKNNVYVVVGEEWDRVLEDKVKPYLKIREVIPEDYYSRIYTLDERYGSVVDLSKLDPSYIYLYFYYGNHEILILARYVLENLSERTVYNVNELKDEIFWKLLEPTIGLRRLEERVEKLVRSLGISRFFFSTTTVFGRESLRTVVVLYVDTEEPGSRRISSDELLKLGRAVRGLNKYIRRIVILDQPFHPTDYFSIIRGIRDIENRTQSDFMKIIQRSVPCGLGDGFTPPDIYSIVIYYPCVIENYVKSPDELEKFVDNVLNIILSLPEYGSILAEHRWLLHIDEPTPVIALPGHPVSGSNTQASLSDNSSTCNNLPDRRMMVISATVTTSMMIMVLLVARHKIRVP